MFVFGHIGVGRQLVSRWRDALPALPLLLGTLLPDIIDKPLYYAKIFPYVSCTRTFGHTGLLVLLLLGAAQVFRSRALAAVGVGAATHLLLDCAMDFTSAGPSSAWIATTWPLQGSFAISPKVLSEHLLGLWDKPIVMGEVLGLALLVWQLRRRPTPVVRPSPL
jgi:LexA-binding, inner membrane-associated putative hydrolase